jgi:hypothetical protein
MRRRKDELATRFGYRLDALLRFLEQRQRDSRRPLVNRTKRPKKGGRSRAGA